MSAGPTTSPASGMAAPSFIRVESMQCVAQSIPSIMAAIPQTQTPISSTGLVAGNLSGQVFPLQTVSPVTPLSYPAASHLAHAVEVRLKALIRSAQSFRRHSQRRILTTEDVNLALRHKNAAPIYGYENAASGMTTGVGSGGELSFAQASEDLFLLNDPLISFDDLLAQPLPNLPPDTTFSLHWLAIDGVQPLIPENPGLESSEEESKTSAVPPPTTTVQLDKSEKEVTTKPPIKHVLSKEQTLYYEYVTSALRGSDSTLKKAVYKSLSEDDGLYQLLPYFTQFIAEEVSKNLHNLPFLTALMRTANCLIFSPYLHVEPYLHQLMPPILTCIVGKQLCLEPFEEHWGLRDYASDMLLLVCQRYSHHYPSLQPRVTKTLCMAWMDETRSLNTHYGCIVTLRKLGPMVVKKLVIPYVKKYFQQLQVALNSKNDATKMEANFVYQALLLAVGEYVRYELDTCTNPSEMAQAVLTATSAALTTTPSTTTATANGHAPMETDLVVVKQEPIDNAPSSKKRRRGETPTTATANVTANTTTLSSTVLPDRAALDGIELLLDLFGEALQPYVTAGVQAMAEREAQRKASEAATKAAQLHAQQLQLQQQQAAAMAPVAVARSGKIVISRNNLTAANTFL